MMKDRDKTKEQLLKELAEMRRQAGNAKVSEAPGSEKLLEALAGNSTIGVYVVQDGKFLFTNTMFQRYVGYSEEELLSIDSLSIVYHEDRDMVREKAVKMLKGGTSSPYEFRYVNKSGECLWVMETVSSVQYQGKQATLGSFVDTTQRKQIEEKYRKLVEGMNDGYAVIQAGIIVFANRRFDDIFGYRHGQSTGMSFTRIVAPEHRQKAMDWYEKVEHDEALTELREIVGVKEDGTAINIEASIKLIQYEDKPALSVVVRDISERKQMDMELSDSEGRFWVAFEKNPTSMTISTLPEGRVIYVNDSFLRMVEYSREEVIGHTSVELNLFKGQKEREHIIGSLLDDVEDGGRELKVQTKTGRILTVLSWGREVTIKGQPHFVSMSIDISDRKNLEEKYVQLLEDMHDGYGVMQDEKYVFVNRRFGEILGYNSEEIIGKPFDTFFTDDSRKEALGIFERMVTNGEEPPDQPEATMIKSDGTEVILEASIESIDYEGKPAFGIIMRDVTRRRQLEENYRQLLDDMNDSYYIIQDGKVTFANRRYCEMFGYEPEQVKGMPIELTALPENRQSIVEMYERVVQGKGIPLGRFEGMAIKADGTTFIAESSIKSIQYEGKPAFSSITRDITERKQMEKAMIESGEKLRLIFESVPEGIIITDFEGNITEVNSSAVSMHGYNSKEELIGQKGIMLVAERDRNLAVSGSRKTWEGETIGIRQAVFLKKEGDEFPVMLSTAIMKDAEEKPSGMVTIVADITEQQQRQDQLMLTDRLASLGQLAAGIAHEINNPLTGIIGLAELMLEKDIPGEIKEDLKIIDREAQRAADVVRGLLTFVRSKGKEKTFADIGGIIQDVLRLRAYEQEVNNIKVETQFAPGLPMVLVSTAQMQQVFMNIIINAEQAMLEANGKGRLDVTAEQVGDVIRVSIKDDGPGISEENMKRLFTPFFTTKEVGKGTGLGLSICHGIIKEHGGRIYAESEPAKGAAFIIELPVSAGRN